MPVILKLIESGLESEALALSIACRRESVPESLVLVTKYAVGVILSSR